MSNLKLISKHLKWHFIWRCVESYTKVDHDLGLDLPIILLTDCLILPASKQNFMFSLFTIWNRLTW